MNAPNPWIANLQELQKKMRNQDLSVLVGAGYSKNVDPSFPSWTELLTEMVHELKCEMFERDFKKSRQTASAREDYLYRRTKEFITEIGPLKVASLYRERMGYREALEYYIEKRTPFVDEDKELHYVENGISKTRKLSAKDLEVHDKLVNLPWNNIYTTNYDNLLECCIDRNVEAVLKKEQQSTFNTCTAFEVELTALEEERSKLEKEYETIEKNIENLTNRSLSAMLDDNEREELERCNNEIYELRTQLAVKLGEIQWKKGELKRHRELLSKVEAQLQLCATVVEHSAELAVKRSGNIIKLHGSLRKSEDEQFGFDTDPRKHYVIAHEDYETYPEKHEAFTQLMRISLLREAFCLFGFSGTDPNFLAWIGWVRDVIFRKPNNANKQKSEGDKTKIYLITTGISGPDKAIETFYRNHHIESIPILHPECISFLEEEVGRNIDAKVGYDKLSAAEKAKRIKDVLSLLLDFLRISAAHTGPRVAMEISKRSEFENLCRDLYPFRQDRSVLLTPGEYVPKLIEIARLVDFNRLPSPLSKGAYNRLDFLLWYPLLLKDRTDEISIEELLGARQLIRSQYYPHSTIFVEDKNEFSQLLAIAKNTDLDAYHFFVVARPQ